MSSARRLAALNAFDLSEQTTQLPAVRPITSPLVVPVVDGCRRCAHAAGAHKQVGFYPGERERCACGCDGYRLTWHALLRPLVTDPTLLTLVGLVVFVLVGLWWFG